MKKPMIVPFLVMSASFGFLASCDRGQDPVIEENPEIIEDPAGGDTYAPEGATAPLKPMPAPQETPEGEAGIIRDPGASDQ